MGNRIFGSVVLLLWGSTMTWLVTAKILPAFFDGEPPVATLASHEQPSAWRISLNNRPCGVAAAQAVEGAAGLTEVHSRLKIDSIPLPEVAPKWMRMLLAQFDDVSLSMRARTTLDTLGHLATFETHIRVNENPSTIRMSGTVHEDKLRLSLRTGEYSKLVEYPWRGGNAIAGELMPTARLTNLQLGKKWRTEVYNPFGRPDSLMTMIEAEVVEIEELVYEEKVTPMYHIVYRGAQLAGVSESDRVRSEVWVTESGDVVRHDMVFLNAHVRFERLPLGEAEPLAAVLLELDRYATTTVPNAERDAGGGANGR